MNRSQAVDLVGERAVSLAEATNCEPTGRCGYNGRAQGDASVEWRASAPAIDREGYDVHVHVYYYTDEDADWDAVDWSAALSHYDVV